MTPGMPSDAYAGPDGTRCKVLHCGERVAGAKSGEREMRRGQLRTEVD